MEEEHGSSSNSSFLETGKAERSVWLMKCPLVVAKSWQNHPSSDPHPLAKVVLSLDPLQSDSSSSLQVTLFFFFNSHFNAVTKVKFLIYHLHQTSLEKSRCLN